MTKSDAIKLAGSATKLARIFGITPSAVGQWGEELSKERRDQLKGIKPGWFRVKKNKDVSNYQELF